MSPSEMWPLCYGNGMLPSVQLTTYGAQEPIEEYLDAHPQHYLAGTRSRTQVY